MSPQPRSYFLPKGILCYGTARQDFLCCILIAPQRPGSYWQKIWKKYNFQASEKGRNRLEFGAHLYWWNLSSSGIIVCWLFNFLEIHLLFAVFPSYLRQGSANIQDKVSSL